MNRFVVQFRNGIWQVFDTHAYTAARARPLFKQAARDAEELNARKRDERPRRR